MRKLLVWDGDETLWRGTLADGDEVSLPEGREALCEDLYNRGVLQSLATFNTPDDARATLHRLGLAGWFLHTQASFEVPKSQMVRAVIQAYGLSREEDVAFVDDSALNRADVSTHCSGVVVVAPFGLGALIDEHFTKAVYTAEDRLRVRRYQSEQQRALAAQSYGADYLAFLRSCQISMVVERATAAHEARVLDLARRANRMAAVLRPFADEEWRAFMTRGELFVAHVKDRFGDYGLSAFGVLTGAFCVEALVVSCRLQGRGIGSAFLAWLNNRAPRGALVTAEWAETPYNAGIRGLYEWYGFGLVAQDGRVMASRSAEITPLAGPEWVRVEER